MRVQNVNQNYQSNKSFGLLQVSPAALSKLTKATGISGLDFVPLKGEDFSGFMRVLTKSKQADEVLTPASNLYAELHDFEALIMAKNPIEKLKELISSPKIIEEKAVDSEISAIDNAVSTISSAELSIFNHPSVCTQEGKRSIFKFTRTQQALANLGLQKESIPLAYLSDSSGIAAYKARLLDKSV